MDKEGLGDALSGLEEFEDSLVTDTDDDTDTDTDTDADTDTDTDSDTDTDTDNDNDNDKDDQIASLKADIAALKELVTSGKAGQEEKPPELPKIEVGDLKVEDIVGDDFDFDKMTHTEFNGFLNKAATVAVKHAVDAIYPQLLRSLPEIVRTNVSMQTSVVQAVTEFYAGNKDLVPFKKVVKLVAEELASKNPEWRMDKLFAESGKETRRRLGLKAQEGKKPGDARPRGQRRKETPAKTGAEKGIDDMLNALG